MIQIKWWKRIVKTSTKGIIGKRIMKTSREACTIVQWINEMCSESEIEKHWWSWNEAGNKNLSVRNNDDRMYHMVSTHTRTHARVIHPRWNHWTMKHSITALTMLLIHSYLSTQTCKCSKNPPNISISDSRIDAVRYATWCVYRFRHGCQHPFPML